MDIEATLTFRQIWVWLLSPGFENWFDLEKNFLISPILIFLFYKMEIKNGV